MSKRVQVTLDDDIIKVINKAKIGDSESKKIANIVVSYLSEKGYLK